MSYKSVFFINKCSGRPGNLCILALLSTLILFGGFERISSFDSTFSELVMHSLIIRPLFTCTNNADTYAERSLLGPADPAAVQGRSRPSF